MKSRKSSVLGVIETTSSLHHAIVMEWTVSGYEERTIGTMVGMILDRKDAARERVVCPW